MTNFSKLLKNSPEYKSLLGCVSASRGSVGVLGLSNAPKAHVISSLVNDSNKTALVLVPDERIGHQIAADMTMFGVRAEVYPYRDYTFRFTDSKSREFEHTRIGVLKSFVDKNIKVVVATAQAAAQLTIPEEELLKKSVELKVGKEVTIEKIVESLVAAGYSRYEEVEGAGQFAVRGGIVDFYPPDHDNPVRVELWGDVVDGMAYFDVLTQRRLDIPLDEILITPSTEIVLPDKSILIEKIQDISDNLSGKGAKKAREKLNADIENLEHGLKPSSVDKYLSLCYDTPECLFDYCKDSSLFVVESSGVKNAATAAEKIYIEELKSLYNDGVLCSGLDRFTLSFSEVLAKYEEMHAVYIDNFARGSFDTPVKDLITFNSRPLSSWNGNLSQLLEDIYVPFARNFKIIVFAGSEKTAPNLAKDLIEQDVPCEFYSVLPEKLPDKTVTVLSGSISAGIEYPLEKVIIFSLSTGLSGSKYKKGSAAPTKKKGLTFSSVDDLNVGDYVVHENYGIGIFDGIHEIAREGVTKDYIKIKYAGTDVLYVPVNQLDIVSKYIGAGLEEKNIKLNRLDSVAWERTKRRVAEKSKEMAAELIKLYSERIASEGFAFSQDTDLQVDFESRFEFVETEDQLRTIAEIKRDMENDRPMDRLLCGDVGFGKTEVALRAAFKCVADGKQCAMLVPTTILANQHYQTILKRFEGFPISAEMISRFRTPKEQKDIISRVKSGRIDILVGTHSILSSRIEFKDLGLLIIDEEQRFGVAQKEKIKARFPNVDVLTLSATPIPRTLNMALSGIRDMSIIEQSPRDRLPIQSFVLEYDRDVVIEAIRKELRRGGQVYYLHNFVESIDEVASKLQEDIPESHVGVVHGQMSEQQTNDVWRRLTDGEIDVLVCTTIIEIGVDVPNCNTLIVNNADKLGLAQLHQIRGRVGRSTRRATALFTYPAYKIPSETASRRLNAIREYTEFGSGFKIAMRDLEIRGAGSLLGGYQHGSMEAVGYELYMKILTEAIEDMQNNGEKKADDTAQKDCLIDIKIDAYIPDDYIKNISLRLSMYRKIAAIRTEEDASDLVDELIDRFGADIPKSVLGLMDVSVLRNKAAKKGFYEVKGTDKLRMYFTAFDQNFVENLARRLPRRVRVKAGEKPHIEISLVPGETMLETLEKCLETE